VKDADGVERSAVWRYSPAGAAVLAAANFALMWVGTRGARLWLFATGLAALTFVAAVAVQLEAIYKHPERYPEVSRRAE
jgi:hypothetical protein